MSSDQLRKKMFGNRTYSAEEKQMVYDEMIRQMQETLKKNKDVILDATFYKKQHQGKIY